MGKTTMNDVASARAAALWIALLAVASTATTIVFACATPFPALAAVAAVYLRRRNAVALLIAAWTIDQAIGFAFKGYPHDTATLMTGCAIGTAAVASALAAIVVADAMARGSSALRLVSAYVAGFVAFKLAIALWVPFIGHADAAFSVEVVVRQFVRNAAILAGLVALYHALTAAGVPSVARRQAVAA